MRIQTIPILFVFLMMGVADAMGPMSEAVRENYELSNVTATLLSFFVFIAFAVFSVPGGLLAARIGKKRLLLLGLGLNAAAMLIPCLVDPTFAVLLGCIFVLGIGTTFLQVAGNPIMHDVSAEGKYGRNLSFAQGFKGIGSSVSSYLVTAVAGFAIFKTLGWRGVFPIFFVLMAAAFIWVCTIKVNETKADVPPSLKSGLGLLKKPVYALAVLGIFLYVGSEVCMARFLLPLLEKMGL
ncbi:MFS transporter, partial [Sedimentisphaera salicampi]